MPHTDCRTLYFYDELTDRAKATARDWYRQISAGDNYFAESPIADAETLAPLLGIELAARKGSGRKAIYWSGFSCQGDGASWEGRFIRPDASAMAAVLAWSGFAEFPTSAHDAPGSAWLSRLFQVAADIDALPHGTAIDVRADGRYSHSGTMRAEPLDETTIEGARAALDACRAFADWIYRQLEAAYDDSMADETIAETIRANEYDFHETGRRAC